MRAQKPLYHPALRAVVLLVLISAILISLFIMGLGMIRHDESHDRHDLRKAYQELEKSRKK